VAQNINLVFLFAYVWSVTTRNTPSSQLLTSVGLSRCLFFTLQPFKPSFSINTQDWVMTYYFPSWHPPIFLLCSSWHIYVTSIFYLSKVSWRVTTTLLRPFIIHPYHTTIGHYSITQRFSNNAHRSVKPRPTKQSCFYLATVRSNVSDKHTILSYYFISTCHQPRFLPGSYFRFNTTGVFKYTTLCTSAQCLLPSPEPFLLTCHRCLVNHSIKSAQPFYRHCFYLLVTFSPPTTHQASDTIYYFHFCLHRTLHTI